LKETKIKLSDNEDRLNNLRKEKTETERELVQYKIRSEQLTDNNNNLKSEINCFETQLSSINHSYSVLKQDNENQYKTNCE